MPVAEPKCDHICLRHEGHVERGEPHFYGYEIPSPRDTPARLAHEVWQLKECLRWLCEQFEVEVAEGTRGDSVPGPFVDGKDGWEPIPDTYLPFITEATNRSPLPPAEDAELQPGDLMPEGPELRRYRRVASSLPDEWLRAALDSAHPAWRYAVTDELFWRLARRTATRTAGRWTFDPDPDPAPETTETTQEDP